MPALTIENAQLKTISVEIQALVVGGKQVTLSVFRQLVEENIINHDGSLAGTPWGWVNYKLEGYPKEAKNLVWVKGRELRRCIIKKPCWDIFAYAEYAPIADFVRRGGYPGMVSNDELWRCAEMYEALRWPWEYAGVKGCVFFHANLTRIMALWVIERIGWPSLPYHLAHDYGRRTSLDEFEAAVFALWRPLTGWHQRRLFTHVDWENPTADGAEFVKIIKSAFSDEAKRRALHEKRWQELQDLPQLFIAV